MGGQLLARQKIQFGPLDVSSQYLFLIFFK